MLYVGSVAWACAKARQGTQWKCCSLSVSICPNASILERHVSFRNGHQCGRGSAIINKKNKQTNQHRANARLLLIRGLHSPHNHVQIKRLLRRNSISHTANGWLIGRLNWEIGTQWPHITERLIRTVVWTVPHKSLSSSLCLLLQHLSNRKTALACRPRLWK